MKLLVFGNPYLNEDNLALIIADNLQRDFEFTRCTSPDEILNFLGEEIIILDVVKNSGIPMLITDLNQIKKASLMSLHDFDVGYFLALLQNMEMLPQITIIGVPPVGDIDKITQQVKSWIKKESCLLS